MNCAKSKVLSALTCRSCRDLDPVSPQTYQETIAKDTEPKTAVLRISATDADSDANGAIEYYINASRPADAEYFSIEPRTGVISLARKLTKVRPPGAGEMAGQVRVKPRSVTAFTDQ